MTWDNNTFRVVIKRVGGLYYICRVCTYEAYLEHNTDGENLLFGITSHRWLPLSYSLGTVYTRKGDIIYER